MKPIRVGVAVIARKFFDMAYVESIVHRVCSAVERPSVRVIVSGPLFTADQAREASDALAREGCDALVMVCATFADAAPAAALVSSLDVPVLLWALAEPPSDTGRVRLNSYCGANLAGNVLTKLGKRYSFAYGDPTDLGVARQVESFLRVQAVRKQLKKARIGVVGSRPDGYYACNFDETELRRVVGPEIDLVPVADLLARASSVSESEVRSYLDGLATRTVDLEKLPAAQAEGTARSYLSLRALAAERGYDAVAVRCWPEFFDQQGHAACGAVSGLIDDGVMAGCEADLNATATMLAMHYLTGEAAFVVDVVKADPSENTLLLWHCGAGPLSMASPSRTPVVGYQPNRKLGIALWFGMKAGPVTVARLSQTGDGYRMLLMKGVAIDRQPEFPHGSSAVVRMEGNAMAAARAIVEQGFEHHVVMGYGDVSEEMAALAQSWRIPLVRL